MSKKEKEKTTMEKRPKKTKKEEKSLIEESPKKVCRKCNTSNDENANYCKNCGLKFKREQTKEEIFLSISKLLQILAIIIAIDAMFQVRIHMGTVQGDNLVIRYAFLLATTLLFSTIFRLRSNNVTLQKIKNNKFKMSKTTDFEATLIIGVYVLAIVLFLYSNSRIAFLRPGNNYVERKMGQFVTRFRDVDSYSRVGIRKCPRVNWYSKYLPNYTFFCYEYTYSIEFEDGESCFVKYRSRYSKDVDIETFSYCNKK